MLLHPQNVMMSMVIEMKKTLLLATHNKHKLHEFRSALEDLGISVISLDEIGFHDEIDETGTSFEENALLKAKALKGKSPYPIIADDSGLSINCLDGFPGIYSSRFMEGSPYQERCKALIEKVNQHSDRSAYFTCVIAYINENGEHYFKGECHGEIAREMHGEQGFGYDPIFFVPELNKTYAEIDENEKNIISHRGKAVSLLKEFLQNN